jgi:putative ABC transport system permease protein
MNQPQKMTPMLKNYLTVAWRNMRNNKVYSALNVVGLAMGMAVALLIGLWVVNQYAYDRFLPHYEQAYQVEVNYTTQRDGTHTQTAVSLPLAGVLRTTIPGIESVAETDWVSWQSHDLLVGTKKLLINGGAVHPDFLKIFPYPMVKGNANTAFKDPFSIILTESTAKALFGNDDPINKTIRVDNQHDVKVTGIMKDLPATSTFQFQYLFPFAYKMATEDWMKNATTSWTDNSFEMFVKLKAGADFTHVSKQVADLIGQNSIEMRQSLPEVILHPLKDWHLYSDFKNGKAVGGFIDYVRMFGIIGALVLFIACINFINLSTARSEKRAREVGVRKAIGSRRSDLIYQFLTESMVVVFVAFLLCLLLVRLTLPAFNTLAGASVTIPYGSAAFWGIMLAFVFATGLLAGSRPAFYLSSFKAVKVLKGTFKAGSALPRKILVVAQFSCSVALIISTVIIYRQLQYAKDRPIGYSYNRLVSTPMSDDLLNQYAALKNDLLASGAIESVTKASSPMTGIYSHAGIIKWPGQTAGDLGFMAGDLAVVSQYFSTVGMQFVAGSDFSSEWARDTTNVILNEAAIQQMGLKDPIGQYITWGGQPHPSRIIGVVKNALMESPFTPAKPTAYKHGRGGNFAIYRLAANIDPHTAMDKIGHIFDKYNPAYPFSYTFVNEDYDSKFNLETLVGKLAGIFSGLAIFISCLGLFGLAAYLAEQRNKEISIRKVLGASVAQLWMLLSKDFIVLVFLSCVIATPVAFYFLHNWLIKYDYRIRIGPGVFIFSALIAIAIAILTISFQAIKAAVANPSKNLRTE